MYRLFLKLVFENKKNRWLFIFYLIFITLSSVGILIIPYAVKMSTDKLLAGETISGKYFLATLAIVLIHMLVSLMNSYITQLIDKRINVYLKEMFFRKVHRWEWNQCNKYSVGELQYRLFNDIKVLSQEAVFWPVKILSVVIILCIVLYVTYSYYSYLSIFLFFIALIYTGVYYGFQKVIGNLIVLARNESENAYSVSTMSFINIKVFQIYNIVTQMLDKNMEVIKHMLHMNQKLDFTIASSGLILSVIPSFWSIGLIFFGSTLIYNDQMSLGTLIGFMVLSGYVFPLISNIVSLGFQYPKIQISLKNVMEINSIEKIRKNGMENFTFGSIEVKGSYSWDNKLKTLDVVDLFIKDKSLCWLKGANGSGKSTLLKLIGGYIFDKEIQVTIAGKHIELISDKELIKNIYYIGEENKLLPISLYENLTLGVERTISKEEVYNVCQEVLILQKIKTLPNGFDTIFSVDNLSFSSGEMAKLFLARGLLVKPKIWLLDEVIANLDLESKILTLEKLKEISNEATIILVSHDEIVINYSDQIIDL